jgi:hypothetical protein
LLDSHDPAERNRCLPSQGRTTDLACRIYPTGTGFAGMLTLEQLIEAFTKTG